MNWYWELLTLLIMVSNNPLQFHKIKNKIISNHYAPLKCPTSVVHIKMTLFFIMPKRKSLT